MLPKLILATRANIVVVVGPIDHLVHILCPCSWGLHPLGCSYDLCIHTPELGWWTWRKSRRRSTILWHPDPRIELPHIPVPEALDIRQLDNRNITNNFIKVSMEHYKGDAMRDAPCYTQQYVHYLSNTSLHQRVAAEQWKYVTTKGLTPRGSAWDTGS